MTHIRFISTSSIRAAATPNESTRRIELTPWDLQLLLVDPIQKGLLFFKPTPSREKELIGGSVIDHLKTSLSRTLDIFYPLAGRLVMVENNDDKTISFFLDCNNLGAQFVHAVVDDLTVADILNPKYVPDIVNSFFLMNGVLNYQGISKPLLGVQVTELVDGIFIGCTINHCAVDGSSFWHFFNTWSEISRGNIINPTSQLFPPIFQRCFFNGIINFPIHIPVHPSEISDERSFPTLLKQKVFHFSKKKIAQLKAKANAEMGTTTISSLQAVLGHLWRAVVRSRRYSDNQEVHYGVLVGVRQRIQPPLPAEYVGNAVLFGNVTTTVHNLLEHGLGWVAWQINKVIAYQTAEEMKKYIEDWLKAPKIFKFSGVTSNALITGSSPRFNVYGNDFGWGRPITVRSGLGNKSDGKLTVFPGAEEGSIDFEACLSFETLQTMADDEEFMEALAS
ncbi:putative acetyltransferase At3g50280 [Castanea sativa]|uniref:putative acetyltransferase At3g50280 n=1 Tax=Castanea sativa TaxID=21020 RepID=UPI003F650FA2